MAGPQRERIIRTATELFAERGYHATGITELSNAVGLGKGALYHHIRSKEEILYEISRTHVDELIADAEVVVASSSPAPDKIRRLARALMQSIVDHTAHWTVFFREVNSLTGERREAVLERRTAYERLWAQLLDAGAREGTLVTLDPIAVKGVLGMFNYAHLWVRTGGRLDAADIADAFCDLLFAGLLAPKTSVTT